MSTAIERDAGARVAARWETERRRAIEADRAALLGRFAACLLNPAYTDVVVTARTLEVTTWHGARWKITAEVVG